METNKSFILLCVFILIACISEGQTIYHIDPNTTANMMSDNMRSAATVKESGIKLTNDYAKSLSVLLSDNGTLWDTTKIPGNATLMYKIPVKYIKIFSSSDNFVHYKLTNGNCYNIYWNNDKNRWDVK